MNNHQNERSRIVADLDSQRPVIGIAPDVSEPKPGRLRVECGMAYARAIAAAGGYPLILAPFKELIPEHLGRCDGLVLTGGDDPRMEVFGAATHPKATPMHAVRQEFEMALHATLRDRYEFPVLGICLGMQMMALCAGGKLDQHMPETTPTADRHYHDRVHGVVACGAGPAGLTLTGPVTSYHRQAVSHPGSLAIAAMSDDGVIEAVVRPDAAFALGVQWHPERTSDHNVGAAVFEVLVEAARVYRRVRQS